MTIVGRFESCHLAGAAGPYATYAQLRSSGPVLRTTDLFGGAWLLTTHEAVQAALRDPRLSARRTGGWVMRNSMRGSERRRELVGLQRLFARAMLFVDKPSHPRLRQAMQAGFRPSAIEALKPFVIGSVERLLDDMERTHADRPCDFIECFARVLPARIIARLLGLFEVNATEFLTWSSDLAAFIGASLPDEDQTERALCSIMAMGKYFERVLEDESSFSQDGILRLLVQAQKSGQIEKGPELLAQCAMLLFAGHETTRHFLGTSIYWLLRNRDAWDSIRADPTLVKGAVRELLRWDSPVQYTGRRANCDLELHGTKIRRGDLVLPLIGAANRDPAEYADPDAIQIDRRSGMPLSFGSGPHVCIGAALTLMEAEVAIAAIVRRWPGLDVVPESDNWIDSPLYRGMASLHLRLPPRPGRATRATHAVQERSVLSGVLHEAEPHWNGGRVLTSLPLERT
ncbi:cytochrome P450 [Piscinibacter sp.]|uniref:cytochrome P450 n=1 Tax=Piscinibacter sp. TaxID=1903157 RepID=UPI00258D5EC2|nr:cytochrome P450 [Piscinibacter sp.]